jgi:hypothetical protein
MLARYSYNQKHTSITVVDT